MERGVEVEVDAAGVVVGVEAGMNFMGCRQRPLPKAGCSVKGMVEMSESSGSGGSVAMRRGELVCARGEDRRDLGG